MGVASRPALFTITRVMGSDRDGKDYVDDGYAVPDDGYGVPKSSTPTPDYAAPTYTSSVKPCYYKPTTTTTTTAAPSYNSPSSSKGGFPDLFGLTKGLLEGVGRGVEDLGSHVKQFINPDQPEGYGCLEAPSYAAPETETYVAPEDTYALPPVPDSDSYVAPEDVYQPPATTTTTTKPEYLELAPRTETLFVPEA